MRGNARFSRKLWSALWGAEPSIFWLAIVFLTDTDPKPIGIIGLVIMLVGSGVLNTTVTAIIPARDGLVEPALAAMVMAFSYVSLAVIITFDNYTTELVPIVLSFITGGVVIVGVAFSRYVLWRIYRGESPA